MALFWLINSVVIGTERRISGESINDALDNVTALRAAGALLWPQGDPIIDAAAAHALSAKINRGANEIELEAIMQTAVQSVQLNTDGSEVWAAQPGWTISNLTGNDNNAGTPTAPLKTWGALRKKWGNRVFLPGVLTATPFAHQQTTVTFLDAPPITDPIDFDVTLPSAGLLAIVFPATLVRSGTVTSIVQLARATNQSVDVTDTGVVSWVADIGKRIRNTTVGPNLGQYGYIAKDLGGGAVRISRPNNTGGTAEGLISPIPTLGVFSAGDTYVVETLTDVYTRSMKANQQRNSGSSTARPIVGFMNCNFKSQVFYEGTVEPNFEGCSFEQIVVAMGPHPQNFYGNCLFKGAGVGNSGLVAISAILGGLTLNTALRAVGTMQVDMDHLVQGGFISANNGTTIGTCGVFDATDDGVYAGAFFSPDAAAKVWNLSGFAGVHHLYGKDNGGFGLRSEVGGRFINGAFGAQTVPTITGASGDFAVGGATTARAFDEATGAYTTARACTWANFAATIAAGGFGGGAHNVQLDAHVMSGITDF